MLKRRSLKNENDVDSELKKMQKLEQVAQKKTQKLAKKAERAAKMEVKKAKRVEKTDSSTQSTGGNVDVGTKTFSWLKARKELKEAKKENAISSNGKKYKKIKTSIMVAYSIPVLLIVVLGIISYTTASDVVVDKYKTSAGSTVTATRNYLGLVSKNVQSRAIALSLDSNVTRYYKILWKEGMDNLTTRETYQAVYNVMGNEVKNSEYLIEYYIIANNGKPMTSYNKGERDRLTMETVDFTKYWETELGAKLLDGSLKTAWVDNHPFVDDNYFGDPSKYAYSFIVPFNMSTGIVVLDVSKDFVVNAISDMELGEGAIVGFVGPNGTEILVNKTMDDTGAIVTNSMPDGTVVFGEQDFYKEVVSENADGTEKSDETVIEEVTYDGKDYCFFSSPISDTGMTLNVLIPIDTLVKDMSGIRLMTMIFVVLGAILALGAGSYIASGISNVLNKICMSLRKVANGDLTQNFETKRKDELRFLTDSLTETLTGIHALMVDVQGFSGDVGEAAKTVSGSSEGIFGTMQNVSSALEGVAEGVDSQAGDTETCAQLMVDFSSKMNTVHENTRKITETVDKTLESTEKGRSTVAELNKKSTATNVVVKELVQEIKAVVTQSNDISGIIDAINDIAEQTNLLSLNASIEAARAGEQGRGFAVVAEEIRKLADDSMKAGNQIYEILDQIRATTGKASSSAQKTNGFLEDQATVLTDTTQVFGDISGCVDEMVAVLNDIITDINDMIHSKESIASSITNIAAVSEEVAVSTRTVSDSISDQLQTVEELAAQASKLNDKARNLSDSMKRFII